MIGQSEIYPEIVFGIIRHTDIFVKREFENQWLKTFEKEPFPSHESISQLSENLMHGKDHFFVSDASDDACRYRWIVCCGMDDISPTSQLHSPFETIQDEIISIVPYPIDFHSGFWFFICRKLLRKFWRQNLYLMSLLDQSIDDIFKKYLCSSDMRFIEIQDKEDFHGIYMIYKWDFFFCPTYKFLFYVTHPKLYINHQFFVKSIYNRRF